MKIKCPICGTEYAEVSVRFCKTCMYSIGTDVYLTNLLNHPSEEELRQYNQSLEEYLALWKERKEEKQNFLDAEVQREREKQITTPKAPLHGGLIEMVEVEGGTFLMGATPEQGDDLEDNQKLVHKVTLDSFLIGKYEVTQELWESVMGSNPSEFKGSKRPVETVSWLDVTEFCNKLSEKEGLQKAYSGGVITISCNFESNGYRLPTEAEWEYAARGGNRSKGHKYSGSNDIDAVAWYDGNSGSSTHEVGKKGANELGIHDMSGNVYEWCWDRYGDYSSGSQTNPRGPSSGSYRVLRGGGWNGHEEYCRVAFRGIAGPDYRGHDLGFRISRTRN